MPRITRTAGHKEHFRHPLVERLAEELKNDRQFGQPLIEEEEFEKTQGLRISVIWDKWMGVLDEDRTATILRAYEQVEGTQFVHRIASATGFTVPEATQMGMLPFSVVTALRRGDQVSIEQCFKAMIDEGASTLADPEYPQLRFSTCDQAEQSVARLCDRLPGSENVWQIALSTSTTTSTTTTPDPCSSVMFEQRTTT